MALCCSVFALQAAEVEFEPYVGADFTYTDNANLEEESPEQGEIGVLNFGLLTEVLGKKGELKLDYQGRQTYHSYDSNRNKLYHELDFASYKAFGESGFTGRVDASVDILPASVNGNPIVDVISGDLIQGTTASAGLNYQSNKRKYVDLFADAAVANNRYEDDRGNHNNFDGHLRFAQGDRINTLFWLADAKYVKREAHGNVQGTESVRYRGEFGAQQIKGFSPFVRYVGESYLQNEFNTASTTIGDSEYWGPAVRYFRTKKSYIEVSYNFSLDKTKNEDYVGAALNLEPNRRTRLFFEYSKRFFGNAYDFEFFHKHRRIITDVSYKEEPTSFDRRFFVDGDVVEDQKLYKTFNFTNTLDLKRTKYSVKLKHQNREALTTSSDFISDVTYGVGLGIDHKLTRNWGLELGYDWDRYNFERTSLDQIDYYRRYKVQLNQDLAEGFSLKYGYRHNNRSSNVSGRTYRENRVTLNINKRF